MIHIVGKRQKVFATKQWPKQTEQLLCIASNNFIEQPTLTQHTGNLWGNNAQWHANRSLQQEGHPTSSQPFPANLEGQMKEKKIEDNNKDAETYLTN